MKFLLLLLVLLTACAAPAATSTESPRGPTSAPATNSSVNNLSIQIMYPDAETELENGHNARFIVRIVDAAGHPVNSAQVNVTVQGADGQTIVTLPAIPYTEETYRTELWSVPHRAPAGRWRVEARVTTAAGTAVGEGAFRVKPGTGEMLLSKYGFWLDAPTMRGISPSLFGEKGDARNGFIRWGGQLGGGHVLPTNIIELHWRTGDFGLTDAAAVRRFMLEDLGELGFTRVRDLGPFERFQFKQWPGWKVGARGETRQDLIEWVIFYAPEDGRTFGLATTVVEPPANVDEHAILREGFALFPELHANGTAPEPLMKLAPAPELVNPPLGAEFKGLEAPITLTWQGTRPLGENEYYQVAVDYNYKETNTTVTYATRTTNLTLPEELYRTPNCRVFNWQVTIMKQMGTNGQGQPVGVPISYNSLYRYIMWFYPPGEQVPFSYACPNAQY